MRRRTPPGRDAYHGIHYGTRRLARPVPRQARPVVALAILLTVAQAGRGAPNASAAFLGAVGYETRVTEGTRANEVGGRVALASDAAGRFVVAWAYSPGIGTLSDVYTRRYDAAGTALSQQEVRVNTATAGDQLQPAVAMAPDGRYVVAWSGPGDPGNGADVFARRYDAAGAPIGAEFRVNAEAAGDQSGPAVAIGADGGFVVAWTTVAADATSRVVARRFDADGVPAPADVEVAALGTDGSTGVDVASSAGGFVVVWNRRGAAEAVVARRLDRDGAPLAAAFPIDGPATAELRSPRVSMGPDGRFVVAWQRTEPDGTPDVLARRYSGDGSPSGAAFTVNATRAGDQALPAVSVEADGDFVVAWSGKGPGDDTGVYLQRYAASGASLGTELQANATWSELQMAPAVAHNATGNFVVAWTWDFGAAQRHAMVQRFAFNNPPAIMLSSGALSYRENVGAVPIDGGARVADVDSPSFDRGSLAVSLSPVVPDDVVSIRHQGSGDGEIGVNETTVTYAGQAMGTLRRPVGPTTLVVDLNQRATPAAVQALTRNVTFENPRDDVTATPRTVTLVARDEWGEASAVATRTIEVVPVNDPPVAANEAYRVTAGTTLTVPAASGVLANDADADSATLQTSLATSPVGGSLTLAASGAFSYVPYPGFAGTDSFTYRASDGVLGSGLATVTITVDPVACAPRPPVRVEARPAGGALAVTIAAQPNDQTPNNALVNVAIEDARNATIDVPAQPGTAALSGTGNFDIPLAAGTRELRFTVRRRGTGAVQVPLTVTDGCPAWRTFVGTASTAF